MDLVIKIFKFVFLPFMALIWLIIFDSLGLQPNFATALLALAVSIAPLKLLGKIYSVLLEASGPVGKESSKDVQMKDSKIEIIEHVFKTCINCGHSNKDPDNDLCGNCGQSISTKLSNQSCGSCGGDYELSLSECPYCGAS